MEDLFAIVGPASKTDTNGGVSGGENVGGVDEFSDFASFETKSYEPSKDTQTSDDFADFASAFSSTTPDVVSSSLQLPNRNSQQQQQQQQQEARSFNLFQRASNLLDGFEPCESQIKPMMPSSSSVPLQPIQASTLNKSADFLPNKGNQQGSSNLTSSGLIPNTWSSYSANVDINIDNLLSPQTNKQLAPSMNQLAANMNHMNLTGTSSNFVNSSKGANISQLNTGN